MLQALLWLDEENRRAAFEKRLSSFARLVEINEPFDVLLMDRASFLRRRDEAVQTCKRTRSACVLVLARAEVEACAESLGMEVDDWIVEPIDEVDLRARIEGAARRKRAKKRPSESELRYRTLMDHAPEAVVILDVDQGRFVDVNDNAVKLFGLSREALLKVGPIELSPPVQPDGRPSAEVSWQHLQEGLAGRVPAFEWLHHGSSGADIPCEVRLVRLPASGRNLIRGSITDISERKHAEQALRESERWLRTIFEQAAVGVALIDTATGRFERINQFYCDLVGYTPEEMCGINFQHITHPDDLQEDLDNMQRLVAGDIRQFRMDKRYFRKNGDIVWVKLTVSPTWQLGEPPVHHIAIVEDITAWKQAEFSLRESEARFRQLAENIEEVYWLIALDFSELFYISPACVKLFGISSERFYEQPMAWLDVVHADDRARVEARVLERGNAPDAPALEYRIRHDDGSERWIEARTFPVRDEAGQVCRLAGVASDVTVRKQAEVQLRDNARRLQALSRRIVDVQEEERRRLAHELHDEIGQVLTAVTLGLHAALKVSGRPAQEALQDCLNVVSAAIDKVRSLSLDLRPSMLDLLGLEAALRWYAERQEKQTGVRIYLLGHVDGKNLPPELEITCFRIVQEALTNIARHAQARQVWLQIEQDAAELRLTIRDDGVGFDVNAKRRLAGRGGSFGILGMQERAELLGGQLDIDSAPDEGATIQAAFPLDTTSVVPAQTRQNSL